MTFGRNKHRKGPGVACPKCDGATRIRDTRNQDRQALRRRRVCLDCSARFTTIEVPTSDIAATTAELKWRARFNDRFMALDPASQAAVRTMITSLERTAPARIADRSRAFGGHVSVENPEERP